MHSRGAFPILGVMTDSVDLGFVELDTTGFELERVSTVTGRHLLRHSCGHSDFLEGLSLAEITSAAFLHRMDGCKAGTDRQCGICRTDFKEWEAYRHDGHTWVHRDGCPQYSPTSAIPLPSPDSDSARTEKQLPYPTQS